MSNYIITLTQTENTALSCVAMSQDDWIQNVVHDRCRTAIDEIVQIAVAKCLETNTPIPGTKDEIVALAFTNEWVKTAAQRQAEYEAEMAARVAAERDQESA